MNKIPGMSKKNGSLTVPTKDLDMVMIESLESYLIKSYETSLEVNKTKTVVTAEISEFTRNLVIEINIYMTVFICFSGIVGNMLSLKGIVRLRI